MKVERIQFDADSGRFRYYVFLKPNTDTNDEVKSRIPIEVAVSVSETGELADITFMVPKQCSDKALSYIEKTDNANCVASRVFIAMPGLSGDAVFSAPANLELDSAGRIVGLDIQ